MYTMYIFIMVKLQLGFYDITFFYFSKKIFSHNSQFFL